MQSQKVQHIIKNNELKKVRIKNRACYYFDEIIKLEDFNLDNILIEKKSHENTFIYNISFKNLTGSKALRIGFDKIDEFIETYNGTKYYMVMKNMILITTELDVL